MDSRSYLPPDNITMKAANKKNDQSLCNFQTGIGASPHAILDTEQLVSHIRTALVVTISYLQVLMEGFFFQFQQYTNYLQRLMTFWTVLHLNGLIMQLMF